MAGGNEAVGDQDKERHRGLGAARKKINAPHRGVPVVIESHQPVKASKREAKNKKWNESVGGVPEAKGDAGVSIFVLPHGELSVEQACETEEGEIESAPEIKERQIKKRPFPGEQRIVG